MSWRKSVITGALLTVLSASVQASPADWVSPNVPLSSPFYEYIEKFDGMGYLESLPTGTKPYTRMQMAKWVEEIRTKSQELPLPEYLAGSLKEMERDLEPELNVLAGEKADTGVGLKEVRLQAAYYDGAAFGYKGTKAGYQPLNINNNGYRYGENGNFVASAWLGGKLDNNLVAVVEPRFSYDEEQRGQADITSGYIKTRWNGTSIQIGKDPVFWGHGATGSLLLGNNMEPLTSVKISNLEPYKTRGFFRFLGEMNVTGLYSVLEDDRTDNTPHEVNSPSFFALRSDFTPQKNFTFGLSFASMLGGDGRALAGGDYWDWLLGRNADAAGDKWNNIAGLDFKWRLPKWGGVQLYGELYGEDQANYMPSRVAERAGIVIPRLSRDGAWDMRIEYAHTTYAWYVHQLYTSGYIYKGNIIGDPMGTAATQYYIAINRYLDNNSQVSFNLGRTDMGENQNVQQQVNSVWVGYKKQLEKTMFLDMAVGLARLDNAGFVPGNKQTNHFASAGLRWTY
ncbi:putative secreted protein [Propionispora sp. 2/2-37]|uniref:capsule assembly Wzi family protein n=1 Tax=Propionispora sp. 2/2-37 TaxID=1677858 RepID=UPI0006BB844B|nr:capsule assembly Wzi family protein [Propionispora sp. 2/2-37]CUH94462.1 putative secreted protein [Propionispora sp. 2/2-37]